MTELSENLEAVRRREVRKRARARKVAAGVCSVETCADLLAGDGGEYCVRHATSRTGPQPVATGERRFVGRPDWYADAACKGQTGLFFAPHGERRDARLEREAEARALCASCPVSGQCRDAGRHGREFGTWGGETEEQRARAGYTNTYATAPIRNLERAHRQAATP